MFNYHHSTNFVVHRQRELQAEAEKERMIDQLPERDTLLSRFNRRKADVIEVHHQGPIFDPLPIPQSDDDSRGDSKTA